MNNTAEKENSLEFMNLVVDKADNLRVTECDSHFCEFTGVHPSKIKQGKLFLHDIILPVYREDIMRVLCKKDSPYVYFDAEFYDKDDNTVFIHCTGENFENSSLCRLTLADASNLIKKQVALQRQAKEMNYLIDLVTGGVCLFKVTDDMSLDVKYLNEAGCRLFSTTKERYARENYSLEDLIHKEDRSDVFQAIGKAMATDAPVDVEFRIKSSSKQVKWCKASAGIQYYDYDENPVFHAVLTDVTSVKQAEEEADKMYDELEEVFKNIPNAVFSAEAESPLVAGIVSEDFINMLGYSRKQLFEIHQGRLYDFMTEREREEVESTFKNQIEQGKNEIVVTYSIKSAAGQMLVIEDRRKVVVQDDGSKTMFCSWKNVTKKHSRKLSENID